MYPVPIRNITIFPEQPFLLLNTEDYWTTSEQCPEIEDVYYCLQRNLQKHQPCVTELIKTGKNSCPGIPVYFADSSIEQINAREILLIPSTTIRLKSECEEGIYDIKKPSILSLNQCGIHIDGKIFRVEETLHEEFVFDLPSINVTTETFDKRKPALHLQRINNENIKQIKMLANNLRTPNLHNSSHAGHTWTNTALIILVIIIVVAVSYYKFGWIRRKGQKINPDASQKIKEPYFPIWEGRNYEEGNCLL